MKSWLVSLRWFGGSILGSRRCLEQYGLPLARVHDGFFNAGPWRLVAEAGTQMVEQGRNLAVVHAVGKTRHDRAAFALDRANPRQHDIGGVARIGTGDSGRE